MNDLANIFKEYIGNIYEAIDDFKKELYRKNQETILGQAPDYTKKDKDDKYKEGKKPNFELLNKIFI